MGFTKDRGTVMCELQPAQAVSAGIDLWRIDLFDADPIRLSVESTAIMFSRLKPICFAYRMGNRVHVAVFDGRRGICLYEEVPADETPSTTGTNSTGASASAMIDFTRLRGKVKLASFKVSDRPFLFHYREFLEILEAESSKERVHYREFLENFEAESAKGRVPADAKGRFAAVAGIFSRLREPGVRSTWVRNGEAAAGQKACQGEALAVCCPRHLQLAGRSLSLSDARPVILTGTFSGEMNRRLRLANIKLHDEINWVHEVLSSWKPLVAGNGLCSSLMGRTPSLVDLIVEDGALGELQEALRRMPGVVVEDDLSGGLASFFSHAQLIGVDLTFCRGSCNYRVLKAGAYKKPIERARGRFSFSVDAFVSAGKNEVEGSRIALYDMARRQYRSLEPVAGANRTILRLGQIGENKEEVLKEWGLKKIEPEKIPALEAGNQEVVS